MPRSRKQRFTALPGLSHIGSVKPLAGALAHRQEISVRQKWHAVMRAPHTLRFGTPHTFLLVRLQPASCVFTVFSRLLTRSDMWRTVVGSWFSLLVQCICLTFHDGFQLPGRLEIVLWTGRSPTGRYAYQRPAQEWENRSRKQDEQESRRAGGS